MLLRPPMNLKNPGYPATPYTIEDPVRPVPGYLAVGPVQYRLSIPRTFKIISPGGGVYVPPITPTNSYIRTVQRPVPATATCFTQTAPSIRSPISTAVTYVSPTSRIVAEGSTGIPYVMETQGSADASGSTDLILPGVSPIRKRLRR